MENKTNFTNEKKAFAFMKWTLRSYLPYSIAYWILLFISFPMILIFGIVSSMNMNNYGIKGYITDVKNFIPALPGTFFAAIAILFSTVLAIMAFSYLHNKRKVDLFGSFPVGRRTLFFVRYIAVILLSIVPVFVIGMIGGFLGLCNYSIIETLKTIAIIILSVIGNVSFIAFVSLCCGTVADVIISYLAINGAYPICVAICYLFPVSVLPGLNSDALPASVYTLFAPSAAVFVTTFGSGKLFSIIWWIAFSAVLFVVCYVLCKKRKAEAAQNAFAFNILEWVIKFITCFATGFAMGYMLSFVGEMNAGIKAQYIWFFIGVIIAVMTSNILLHLIFHRGLSQYAKSLVECGIVTVCIFVFLLTVTSGAFGYTTRMPEESEIKEVCIQFGEENSFYIGDVDIMAEYTDDETVIDNVSKLHKTLIENIDKNNKSGFFGIIPKYYDDNDYEGIKITYQLNNGKTFIREYSQNLSYKGISKYKKGIKKSEYYNRKENPLNKIPDKYILNMNIGQCYKGEYVFTVDYLDMDDLGRRRKTQEKILKIMNALRKDVREHGSCNASMIAKEEESIALDLQYYNSTNGLDYWVNKELYVPSFYENTLKVLKEYHYTNYIYNYLISDDTGDMIGMSYKDTDNAVYFKMPDDWNPDSEIRCILWEDKWTRLTSLDQNISKCEQVSDSVWKYNIPKVFYDDDTGEGLGERKPYYITFVNCDKENPENIKSSGNIKIPKEPENKLLELGKHTVNSVYQVRKKQYEYQWSDYREQK